jgi:hypothetical protein
MSAGDSKPSAVCVRCGKPIVGTSGDHCGVCLKIVGRQADDEHKRVVRREQAERRKVEGAWPRRGRR